jgi:hypothetical protein
VTPVRHIHSVQSVPMTSREPLLAALERSVPDVFRFPRTGSLPLSSTGSSEGYRGSDSPRGSVSIPSTGLWRRALVHGSPGVRRAPFACSPSRHGLHRGRHQQTSNRHVAGGIEGAGLGIERDLGRRGGPPRAGRCCQVRDTSVEPTRRPSAADTPPTGRGVPRKTRCAAAC